MHALFSIHGKFLIGPCCTFSAYSIYLKTNRKVVFSKVYGSFYLYRMRRPFKFYIIYFALHKPGGFSEMVEGGNPPIWGGFYFRARRSIIINLGEVKYLILSRPKRHFFAKKRQFYWLLVFGTLFTYLTYWTNILVIFQ